MQGSGRIDRAIADEALKLLEVDERGLDKMDRKILITILEKFNGGPVGLETLAVAVNEEKDTLEDVYEPYLIQMGFLDRTPRGRKVTPLALTWERKHPVPAGPVPLRSPARGPAESADGERFNRARRGRFRKGRLIRPICLSLNKDFPCR